MGTGWGRRYEPHQSLCDRDVGIIQAITQLRYGSDVVTVAMVHRSCFSGDNKVMSRGLSLEHICSIFPLFTKGKPTGEWPFNADGHCCHASTDCILVFLFSFFEIRLFCFFPTSVLYINSKHEKRVFPFCTFSFTCL